VSTPPQKGADWKKIFLAVLAVLAVYVLYTNVFSSEPSATGARPNAQPAALVQAAADAVHREASRTSVTEFKPRQGPLRPEDRVDPATIDPTLRLDLLAKVQGVEPEQALRNIFQYGAAVAPPSAKPVDLPTNTPKISVNTPPPGPPATFTPPPPQTSQAPPMTFKYYGFKTSKATGRKEAFLLDGDEIIIAGENDAVKGGRYRIVRIGPNTITVEDTQFKANQTLTLTEEAAQA
jgi:hypothetical protein